MSIARELSMGDPVKALSLRLTLAEVAHLPYERLPPQPAYDVGDGVVMLTMVHRLWQPLFVGTTDAALAAGIVKSMVGCEHWLEAEDVHLLRIDPERLLCAPCARRRLTGWVGDLRRCSSCDADDQRGRLRLVRVPSKRTRTGWLIDVWCLLCPPCLGPIASLGPETW